MFAVEPKYAATNNPLAEFKAMVKAFHKAGIEVILDVVFNHSAESEQTYPTFCQRGIDDQLTIGATIKGVISIGQAAAICSIYPLMLGESGL